MNKQKFKYNIDHYVKLLPRTIGITQLLEALKKENISRDIFYRDRNLKVANTFSIPIDRLEIYAALFGVTVDELKNYESPKIKPLTERNIKIAKKLNIKG
jgi:hypothetical protein